MLFLMIVHLEEQGFDKWDINVQLQVQHSCPLLFPCHLHSQNCYTPGAQECDSLLLCRLQWYMNNMLEQLRNFSKSIKLLQGSRILHYMSIDR